MTISKFIFSATFIVAVFAFGSCSKDDEDDLNGHEYVDLGLPSGTLWATCNVGANSPEELGYYFAWGETTPKDYYSSDNYKWRNSIDRTLTKYTYVDDGKTKLDDADDAATANWGSGWCTPSREQILELLQYTVKDCVTMKGVKGITFTRNGNTIFIPCAGYMRNNYLQYPEILYIWTNSLGEQSGFAENLIHVPGKGWTELSRSFGLPVRPVRRHNK